MTVAAGTKCYNLGKPPVIGSGVSWSAGELNAALNNEVAAVIYDEAGVADLAALLATVPDTEFAQDEIANVLSRSEIVEDWRVGEGIAEVYLTHHRGCSFPWPDGRDERAFGASLPGADLVGFQVDASGDRFAFGEVKTSADTHYPPQVLYGRMGLKQQLEDLRDRKEIRDKLMKYLGHRAHNAAWVNRFKAACKRYLRNHSDVQLYGVLVRDVPPHEDDLRVRVAKLAVDCPGGTGIELLCLYLDNESISKLAAQVASTKASRAR